MDRHRLDAAKELGVLFGLWNLTVWGAWRWTGASVWTVAGMAAFAVFLTIFIFRRRREWKQVVLRLDNFWPALARVGIAVLVLLALTALGARTLGLSFPVVTGSSVARTVIWGIVQEAILFGYLFQRWNALIKNPAGAVFANAFGFGLVHLPDMGFATLTSCVAILFGMLFLRDRNVIALGLAHAVVSLLILPMLGRAGVIETTRIVPRSIAPLEELLAREWKPGDRLAVGPRSLALREKGLPSQMKVELIGEDTPLHEGLNRDHVKSLLSAEGRFFWLVTEPDYRRYVEPELRGKLFVLSARYMWHPDLTLNHRLLEDIFSLSHDVPILGALRLRVLLISNRSR